MSTKLSQHPKVHRLPRNRFPFTIQLFSCTGEKLWERVVDRPADVSAVEIPSYGGTKHTPVSCRIAYADGTVEHSFPESSKASRGNN